MGLFDWLGKQIDRKAHQRTRIVVGSDRILADSRETKVAVADQHYIRIWLSEMFLSSDKKWFSSRLPLTYSLVALDYGGNKVELANVSGKNRFDIKQPDLGKAILRNYALTPLLPFKGGTVEFDCGLVSIEANNILQSFASVVSDIASKLNAPQVAGVIGIASSVAGGVQELLGAGKAETVLYVHDTFTAGSLQSGYIFLSDKKINEINPAEIWITDDGVRTGTSSANLTPPDQQNYIVLRIEVADERDDARAIVAISEPLDAAAEARLEGDEARVKQLIIQAKKAAIKCPDLTRRDIQRILVGIDKEFAAPLAMAGLQQGGDAAPRLTTIEKALDRVSISEADTMKPVDLEAILRTL